MWLAVIGLLCFEFDVLCAFASVLHHLKEKPSLLDQLVRRSHLHDSPSVHNDDLVVVCHSDEPVGDGDDGGFFELLLQNFLDEGVGLHVYVGSGFVKY